MKYLISVIDHLKNPGTAAEMIEIDKFNNRNDVNMSTGKPLFDAQENFTGLWLVEAESAQVAERLAHSASKACNRKVELRPLH